MSATVWLIIAVIGFSLAGVALVASVFMFLKMNIPGIIGDLTGRTVAREIKAIRASNAISGDKRFKSSKVNIERGTLTDKVNDNSVDKKAMSLAHISKRLDQSSEEFSDNSNRVRSGTVGLAEANCVKDVDFIENNESNPTEILEGNVTEVLINNTTELLSDNTEVLSASASDTTTVLNGTTVLDQTAQLHEEVQVAPAAFRIVESVVMVDTDEVI